MLICIDIGNTNITIGGFQNDELKFTSRIATNSYYTEDQYAITISDIIHLYGYEPKAFSLSSQVGLHISSCFSIIDLGHGSARLHTSPS